MLRLNFVLVTKAILIKMESHFVSQQYRENYWNSRFWSRFHPWIPSLIEECVRIFVSQWYFVEQVTSI